MAKPDGGINNKFKTNSAPECTEFTTQHTNSRATKQARKRVMGLHCNHDIRLIMTYVICGTYFNRYKYELIQKQLYICKLLTIQISLFMYFR